MAIRCTLTFIFSGILMLASLSVFAISLNGFDLSNSSLPINEILHGGPPRDGIPAIDRPKFVTVNKATFLQDDDRVLGVYRNGIAKAYSIRILNWHEIVNDVFSDEPIVVSFCPLCGTGTAYSVLHSKAKTFGVSGLLYNSDLLLYDRETESLWSQILGKAISGQLQGESLGLLPVKHTTWGEWRKRHPDTVVLDIDTGYNRDYNRTPYSGYENSEALYFKVKNLDKRYHPKEQVIGVEINGHTKVYPFSELAHINSDVTDLIGGNKIFIRFNKKHWSAHVIDSRGDPIPSITGYWFAWMAFHPDSEVFSTK